MRPPDTSPDRGPGPRRNPFEALRERLGDSLPPGPDTEPPRPPGTPESDPAAPVRARVTVRHERSGRGGKTVTVAEGPGLAGRALDLLAREAGRALGVGARAEGEALVLQGDQRDRLIAWLGRHGFERVVRGS